MAVRARWKGKDPESVDFGYISGIPARSLDEDEYDALDADQKKAVQASPLYDVRSERDSKTRRSPHTLAQREEQAAADATISAELKGGGS